MKRNKPLRRSARPIKRATLKRASERAKYYRKVAVYKREHPWCAACETLNEYRAIPVGVWRTDDIHHKMGREGALLLDERYWMPVCRWCHDWIEDHGVLARELGFVLDKDYRNVAN